IANILAYLGAIRHRTAICGVVGEDSAGRRVLSDLNACNVDTSYVERRNGRQTRMIYILRRADGNSQSQFGPRTNSVTITGDIMRRIPMARILIFGRANKSAIEVARQRREIGVSIALHLKDVPWRNSERSLLFEMLSLIDIVVLTPDAAKQIGGPDKTLD